MRNKKRLLMCKNLNCVRQKGRKGKAALARGGSTEDEFMTCKKLCKITDKGKHSANNRT